MVRKEKGDFDPDGLPMIVPYAASMSGRRNILRII